MREVSPTPRLPILAKRSRPPIVIVPKLSAETLSPDSRDAAVPCPQGYLDHATRENGRLKRDKAWTRRLSSRDAGDVLDAPSRA